MNTIREIIEHSTEALKDHLQTLVEQLLTLAAFPAERVRVVVAECIGRLFATYPGEVGLDICEAMNAEDKT